MATSKTTKQKTAAKAVRKRLRRRRTTGDPYLISVEHRVRFATDDPVSVEAVIASLRGFERIVQTQLPKAIKELTGARIKHAELLVVGLEDGSLTEDLIVKLLFKSKEDYDVFLEKVSDVFKAGHQGGTPMLKGAIVVVIAALLVGGLLWAITPSSAAGPSQGSAVSNIQGDNNDVIIIGAEAYKQSPEAFQAAIDAAMSKGSTKRATQAALDATAPAREKSAAMEFEGVDEAGRRVAIPVISAATAATLPKTVSAPDVSEDAAYSKASVHLRASDYDSAVKGWAGTIPGIVDTRTRVVFANDAEAAKAAFKPVVDADVIVTYSTPLHQRAILILVEKVY